MKMPLVNLVNQQHTAHHTGPKANKHVKLDADEAHALIICRGKECSMITIMAGATLRSYLVDATNANDLLGQVGR